MHVVLRDGYEAQLTAQWHKIREVQVGELFPDCRDLHGAGTKNDVIRSSVVEITANFPQVNGFDWPVDRGLGLGVGTNMFEVVSCGEHPGAGPADLSSFTLSPKQPTVRIMFEQSSEKTPANPSGTPKTDYLKDANFAVDDTYGTCTGTGLEQVATKFCRMRYSD